MKISGIEFQPFIKAVIPDISDPEPRLVMFIKVNDKNTSPRVQCSICGRGSRNEKNWIWKWYDYEPMPDWLKPYFVRGMEIIDESQRV